MSKVKEFFGLHTRRNDVDWQRIVSRQRCPYTGKKCGKVRKSKPDISIGICTVDYSQYNEVMICPHRMLERMQIFTDCMHLLTMHEPGNELHLLSEVSVPGGNVDYFLVSVYKDKAVDFVGMELQTLDTTGSLWSERALLLESKGIMVSKTDLSTKTFGMNWKMSAKTILVQMHHKIQTFEYLNKHLALVIQDCFYNYIAREFNLAHMKRARQGDSFHIHAYSLEEDNGPSFRIRLNNRTSTDANGIARCLGLKANANIELEKIMEYIQSRISEKTLMGCV